MPSIKHVVKLVVPKIRRKRLEGSFLPLVQSCASIYRSTHKFLVNSTPFKGVFVVPVLERKRRGKTWVLMNLGESLGV